MNRMLVLLSFATLAGCQEYQFDNPSEEPVLPPLPPTVYPPVATPPVEPVVPVAEAPVYANTAGELFEVDPVTGTRLSIGEFRDVRSNLPVSGFYDIAIDSSGVVYGGTDDSIYRIDPVTAQVERLCDSSTRPLGMAFTPDDRLLVAGDAYITQVNLGDCRETDVVADTAYTTSGDIVGLPDGFIYWTVSDSDHSDGLVRIDPSDWSLHYMGVIPVGKLFGIGYANDQLFGFSRYGDTVSITPADAPSGGFVQTTVLRTDADISWWGATTNPVAWE